MFSWKVWDFYFKIFSVNGFLGNMVRDKDTKVNKEKKSLKEA